MIDKLNYSIFRVQGINTLQDLAQIGSHKKCEKKAYQSNPDIDITRSKDNIELVPLTEKYVKGFYNITKEYKKEFEEKQKTERVDRKRTFNQMLNTSKSVVADEYIFTASKDFFKDKNKEEILEWANVCMDFVYNDLGYKKEQILHSTIHLDEGTPHIHCVAVPLIKKYDKRTKTERYTISKKQYIKDKIHLSELQDIYNKRLTDSGYDLERGIKNSDTKHQSVKEFKKTTRFYEKKVDTINKNIDNAMKDFNEKMKTTKSSIIDKEYVKVKKDTFDSMNKVIEETKKAIEFQPKVESLFNEIDTFTRSHKSLETENKNIKREIKALTTRNQNLNEENKRLKDYLFTILKAIKEFFRTLLHIGNEKVKEATTNEIKDYYDNNDFNSDDVYDIAVNTTKEDELFDYVEIPDYMRSNDYENDKDDFDIGL